MWFERPKVCASGEAQAKRRAQRYSYVRLRSSISQRKSLCNSLTGESRMGGAQACRTPRPRSREMLSERPKVCASGEAPARRRAQKHSYVTL